MALGITTVDRERRDDGEIEKIGKCGVLEATVQTCVKRQMSNTWSTTSAVLQATLDLERWRPCWPVKSSLYGADYPGLRSKWEGRCEGSECTEDSLETASVSSAQGGIPWPSGLVPAAVPWPAQFPCPALLFSRVPTSFQNPTNVLFFTNLLRSLLIVYVLFETSRVPKTETVFSVPRTEGWHPLGVHKY